MIPLPFRGDYDRSLDPWRTKFKQLLRMTQSQLDELFTASPAGDIPDGEGKGTAIIGA